MSDIVRTMAEFRMYERGQRRTIDHSELLYLIHELSRLISAHFDRVMGRHQLTHAQWWALMHIYEHEGATQTELASIMGRGRASAGGIMERLEEKGWIERRSDPADNRVRRVYLRDPAVPIFMLMNEEGLKVFNTWLRGVDGQLEDRLLQGLRRIRANAEAVG